ncbi:adenylate/guanylate cyclase [Beggiatoa sp. PS]|nr:adenylate/guanylate cyclase [Beggiatoa sp. PS]
MMIHYLLSMIDYRLPSTNDPILKYTEWQREFMFKRLQLGLIVAACSILSFFLVNVVLHEHEMEKHLFWLSIQMIEELSLLSCLILLHTKIGRTHLPYIFLWFSWSITLIPQYGAFRFGFMQFDIIAWSLMFLGQAALMPVRWRLHLLSQAMVFIHFYLINQWFNLSIPLFESFPEYVTYLYFLWFCIICDLSVFLYERLQKAEFEARFALQTEHGALKVEQEKSERLLLNILPLSIAQRLKQEEQIIADHFTNVTVLFADIVGFTQLSERLSAKKLVELLNEIFSTFDKLVEKHGLEKIKTIGDAYMVVGGLPVPIEDSVTPIAEMALDMQEALAQFNRRYHYDLKIRIGIHNGAVVAGVIGLKKFAYDLWGDTVNTASRMESHGIAGCIQVSNRVYDALEDKYVLTKRGTIEIKGKGEMITYMLKGRQV